MQAVATKEYLERLVAAIEEQDAGFIKESFADLYPVDIAPIISELAEPQARYVFEQFDIEDQAAILANLDEEFRKEFIKVFETAELSFIIPEMESDDAADLLEELPVKTREEIISQIEDPETADNIIELLHYEEDCAGGLMAKELIKANADWTVTQTIDEIRRQAENVEKIYSVYVVDDNDRLLGKVGVKKILLSRAHTRIKEIFEEDIVYIESYADAAEVVETMRKYDLEAIPVVNLQGKLLGRITIDDIVDLITEEAEESQQLMSGLTSSAVVDDTIWDSIKARLPWLLIGMAGGLLGAQFIGLYEADLILVPAMTAFIPLVTATGGNVGIQSSTLVVQALANNTFFTSSLFGRFIKIFAIAFLNALTIATIVLGFFLISGRDLQLGLVVGSAMFSVVVLASIMGTITPLILDRLNINPAVASGPFITTANDLLGLAVYFSVARLLL